MHSSSSHKLKPTPIFKRDNLTTITMAIIIMVIVIEVAVEATTVVVTLRKPGKPTRLPDDNGLPILNPGLSLYEV